MRYGSVVAYHPCDTEEVLSYRTCYIVWCVIFQGCEHGIMPWLGLMAIAVRWAGKNCQQSGRIFSRHRNTFPNPQTNAPARQQQQQKAERFCKLSKGITLSNCKCLRSQLITNSAASIASELTALLKYFLGQCTDAQQCKCHSHT